jgi:hypothetical protein
MTQLLDLPGPDKPLIPAASRHVPFGLLNELERPEHLFRDLGPNWFAAVMGTGIVAIAGASLPPSMPGCGSSPRRWR